MFILLTKSIFLWYIETIQNYILREVMFRQTVDLHLFCRHHSIYVCHYKCTWLQFTTSIRDLVILNDKGITYEYVPLKHINHKWIWFLKALSQPKLVIMCASVISSTFVTDECIWMHMNLQAENLILIYSPDNIWHVWGQHRTSCNRIFPALCISVKCNKQIWKVLSNPVWGKHIPFVSKPLIIFFFSF